MKVLTLFCSLPFVHVAAQVPSRWKTLAPVPTGPLHEHVTIALSPTTIAVLGGAASLPVTINHANAAVVNGKMYVLGGMTGASWAGTSRSWMYHADTDTWSSLPAMPTSEARGSVVVGVYNSTIWLVSGKTGSGGTSVTTVSAFDTLTEKWVGDIPETAKNIPEGKDHGGGGIIGDKFYQLGGSLGPISNRKDTVFVLDLTHPEKGWATARGKMPTPRRGFATGIIGTKIYTFGGEGNPDVASNGVFDEVEVYDTERDTWEKLAPMKIPRHGSSAITVNASVYIPAGGTASGTPATDAFDVFTL